MEPKEKQSQKSLYPRRATPEDIDDICRLHRELCVNERNCGFDLDLDLDISYSEPFLEYVNQHIVAATGCALVATAGVEVHAFLLGAIEHTTTLRKAKLESMFVDVHYRQRGVGYALGACFLAWAYKVNAERVSVAVAPGNEPAVALYRKLGFVDRTLILESRQTAMRAEGAPFKG